MLRRIDWSQKAEPREADADAAGDGDEEEEEAAAAKPNACHLVWEVRARPAFPDAGFGACSSAVLGPCVI